MFRYADAGARSLLELTVGALDVRQAVDVELEDLGRVLHAQPVARAQILVHPDLYLVGRDLGHRCTPHVLASHPPTVPECPYPPANPPLAIKLR
ncbi:hypothetical protein Vgi01_16580 [Micromonospora gifhornensis]|uniref:Uncharacterized protein n=1 Tax=Micromonospora gifhornensis TaxID=84594 RepID=A0ABQ4IAN8_9ACTN|nr:hypothetical protein Vgi01_16580 [Micromonospora gifhornensis]